MPDITTTRIFQDAEKGITAQKLNDIVASSVIQPAFYTTKPTASTADPADIALIVKSGAYAQVPVSTLSSGVSNAQITNVRLRSFNAIRNPSFEVDQRNYGAAVVPATGTAPFGPDRWSFSTAFGAARYKIQQINANVVVPGTSFNITQKICRITLTTRQASIAATDYFTVQQGTEGPDLRELFGDVHSVSLLVRSSVANLSFGFFLQDPTFTHSLAKLCTLGAANTWALITLPNLPLWTASGAFSLDPGTAGYYSGLNLTVGSTYMSAANDTWQNSGNTGAVGQMQFATQVVNSTLDIAFVQHEPGSAVSTLIDKPFSQNLDECLRYYQKTYDYDVPIQTASSPGAIALTQIGTTALAGPVRFHKPMAKVPAMTAYSYSTGAPNAVRILSTDYAVSGFSVVGKTGFAQLNGTLPANALGSVGFFHYTADTGL